MKKIVKLTESDIERIVNKTLKEDHAKSDSDKIGYIISALDNLSPEDLDKVYDMVEDLDPNYGEDDLTRLGRKISQGKASQPFWGF